MRARSGLRTKRACDMSVMSRPESAIVPLVGSASRASNRTIVDLPQPNSPTRPTLSPAPMTRSTSSTAWSRAPRASLHRIELRELRRLEQRRRRHSGNLQRTAWLRATFAPWQRSLVANWLAVLTSRAEAARRQWAGANREGSRVWRSDRPCASRASASRREAGACTDVRCESNRLGRPSLDDMAGVHHCDPVAIFPARPRS